MESYPTTLVAALILIIIFLISYTFSSSSAGTTHSGNDEMDICEANSSFWIRALAALGYTMTANQKNTLRLLNRQTLQTFMKKVYEDRQQMADEIERMHKEYEIRTQVMDNATNKSLWGTDGMVRELQAIKDSQSKTNAALVKLQAAAADKEANMTRRDLEEIIKAQQPAAKFTLRELTGAVKDALYANNRLTMDTINTSIQGQFARRPHSAPAPTIDIDAITKAIGQTLEQERAKISEAVEGIVYGVTETQVTKDTIQKIVTEAVAKATPAPSSNITLDSIRTIVDEAIAKDKSTAQSNVTYDGIRKIIEEAVASKPEQAPQPSLSADDIRKVLRKEIHKVQTPPATSLTHDDVRKLVSQAVVQDVKPLQDRMKSLEKQTVQNQTVLLSAIADARRIPDQIPGGFQVLEQRLTQNQLGIYNKILALQPNSYVQPILQAVQQQAATEQVPLLSAIQAAGQTPAPAATTPVVDVDRVVTRDVSAMSGIFGGSGPNISHEVLQQGHSQQQPLPLPPPPQHHQQHQQYVPLPPPLPPPPQPSNEAADVTMLSVDSSSDSYSDDMPDVFADGHADDKDEDVAENTNAAPAEVTAGPSKENRPLGQTPNPIIRIPYETIKRDSRSPCDQDQDRVRKSPLAKGPCARTKRMWLRTRFVHCPLCKARFCGTLCCENEDRVGHATGDCVLRVNNTKLSESTAANASELANAMEQVEASNQAEASWLAGESSTAVAPNNSMEMDHAAPPELAESSTANASDPVGESSTAVAPDNSMEVNHAAPPEEAPVPVDNGKGKVKVNTNRRGVLQLIRKPQYQTVIQPSQVPCAIHQDRVKKKIDRCARTDRKWMRGPPTQCVKCKANFCSAECEGHEDKQGHTTECKSTQAESTVAATGVDHAGQSSTAVAPNTMEMDHAAQPEEAPRRIDKGKGRAIDTDERIQLAFSGTTYSPWNSSSGDGATGEATIRCRWAC